MKELKSKTKDKINILNKFLLSHSLLLNKEKTFQKVLIFVFLKFTLNKKFMIEIQPDYCKVLIFYEL